MAITLDAQILKDRLDSLYEVGRNRHDVVHDLFAKYSKPDAEWRLQDDFQVHIAGAEAKLVRFAFDANFDAAAGESPEAVQKRIDDRLRYVQNFLALMTGPNEEYHLTVEQRPHINDPVAPNAVTYNIHGAIVPKAVG
ncbi:MAG: hypothetical protein QM775_23405 [Pirellulales bacterium]